MFALIVSSLACEPSFYNGYFYGVETEAPCLEVTAADGNAPVFLDNLCGPGRLETVDACPACELDVHLSEGDRVTIDLSVYPENTRVLQSFRFTPASGDSEELTVDVSGPEIVECGEEARGCTQVGSDSRVRWMTRP